MIDIDLIRRAPARFLKSFSYCRDGVRSTFVKEESFRLETIAFCLLVFILLLIDWELWKKLLLVAGYLLIPLVEILNSAIEDLCNLVTRDFSPIVKDAKDKGALAVLFAIIMNVFILIGLVLA